MEYFNTKIIELFGLPKTGKTTTANALLKFLKGKGYKVAIVKERASLSPIKDKLHPSFNFWTSVSFMKEYLEANDSKVDYLIADRGIFDSYVWINLLSKKIHDDKFISSFEKLANQEIIFDNYLLSFYFHATIDKCLEREGERQIKFSPGRIMNNLTLQEYENSYSEVKSKLEKIAPIIETNSTIDSIPKVLEFVSKHILEKINQK
jgi:thymidylate kinase